MTTTIIPVGFGHPLHRDLITRAMQQTRHTVQLIDIKHSPRAGLYTWSHFALRHRYPDRYTWIPKLGNANYENPLLDIAIEDLEGGLSELRPILEQVDFGLIMCGCSNYGPIPKRPHGCHRKSVAEAILARWDDVALLLPEECSTLFLQDETSNV